MRKKISITDALSKEDTKTLQKADEKKKEFEDLKSKAHKEESGWKGAPGTQGRKKLKEGEKATFKRITINLNEKEFEAVKAACMIETGSTDQKEINKFMKSAVLKAVRKTMI